MPPGLVVLQVCLPQALPEAGIKAGSAPELPYTPIAPEPLLTPMIDASKLVCAPLVTRGPKICICSSRLYSPQVLAPVHCFLSPPYARGVAVVLLPEGWRRGGVCARAERIEIV